MKDFVVFMSIVILAGSLFANEIKTKDNKLYVDQGKTIKRQLTLEDRKNLLKDAKALNREKAHKTKSHLGK